MAEYQFYPALTKASIADYVTLFSDAFGRTNKLSTDYLKWQYLENPNGKVIGADAFKGDELAAHYSIIPQIYQHNSSKYKGALSVNTATHPKHQGRRLFTSLAEETYSLAFERGIQFIVGAANGNSFGGFVRRLNFTLLGQVRLYAKFGPTQVTEDALDISSDNQWLKWRLSNPSTEYQKVSCSDSTIIRTWIKGFPFNVGTITKTQSAAFNEISQGTGIIPALTPYFSPRPAGILQIPLTLQPSPWYLIWRTLDSGIGSLLRERLVFSGLNMDTF